MMMLLMKKENEDVISSVESTVMNDTPPSYAALNA